MKDLGFWDWLALIILVLGGLNWGLIGFFSFDLIKAIFGDMSALSRILYALVGISAIYMAIDSFYLAKK